MIRVVVCEDSPTVRELLVAILEGDPEIRVVGRAENGARAVALVEELRPDLVTMDMHMPVMDGLEATREIMVRTPTPIVIVSSSRNRVDVERSFSAVGAGALMVLDKPDSPGDPDFDARCRHLLQMVKAMSDVKVVHRWRSPSPSRLASEALPREPARELEGMGRGRIVAMAASTGGPAAMLEVLRLLPGDFPVPIVIVQHITPGFLSGLVGWLARSCRLRVQVPGPGEVLKRGTIYLAPDHRHLQVVAPGTVALDDGPPRSGHKPSADILFESVARCYGTGALAVVLTGMGADGVEGLRTLKTAGGSVIAQDEESSVVYGMPAAAVEAGLADHVVPLAEIGTRIIQMTHGGSHAHARAHR